MTPTNGKLFARGDGQRAFIAEIGCILLVWLQEVLCSGHVVTEAYRPVKKMKRMIVPSGLEPRGVIFLELIGRKVRTKMHRIDSIGE